MLHHYNETINITSKFSTTKKFCHAINRNQTTVEQKRCLRNAVPKLKVTNLFSQIIKLHTHKRIRSSENDVMVGLRILKSILSSYEFNVLS